MLCTTVVQLALTSMTHQAVGPGILRVLLADTDPSARGAIEEALSGIGERVVTHASCRDELMRLFFEEGPFDLVVCGADIGARSGIMAKARSSGRTGSFIVYSNVGPWLRVFVSNGKDTLLSSRVVSLEGLGTLATALLEASRWVEPS